MSTTSAIADHLVVPGQKALILDGVFSQVMGALAGGAFLVAFALALGANNFQVGLLAALPPLGQLMQIPAVFLLRQVGQRKRVVLLFAGLSRITWYAVAAVPLLTLGTGSFAAIALLLLIASGLGTVRGIGWMSWMRDLVPQQVMGRFFSRRMMFTNTAALVCSVAGGYLVDLLSGNGGIPPEAYSVLFVVGASLGILGVIALSRVPEPARPIASEEGIRETLRGLGEPLKDRNFRALMAFSMTWTFVITFAAHFYVVYMLERLGLSLSQVILISAVGQLANVALLRFWGAAADRFSNRSVLGAAGLLLILAILGWTFTTLPERYFFTVPLLFILHVLMGLSMGGISLAAGNISMKLSPLGQAEAYLAMLGMVNAITAFAAPLISGTLAVFFAGKELALTLSWSEAGSLLAIPTVNLRGLDFLFLITFLLGLYALHRLALVNEEGTVEERVVLEQLKEEIFDNIRSVASFSALRQVVSFPAGGVRVVQEVRRAI